MMKETLGRGIFFSSYSSHLAPTRVSSSCSPSRVLSFFPQHRLRDCLQRWGGHGEGVGRSREEEGWRGEAPWKGRELSGEVGKRILICLEMRMKASRVGVREGRG